MERSVECVRSSYSIGFLKLTTILRSDFFFFGLASIIVVWDILNKWSQIHLTCRGKYFTSNISVDHVHRTSMCHDEMRDYYGNRYISWNRGEMPASRRYSWKEMQETLSSDVTKQRSFQWNELLLQSPKKPDNLPVSIQSIFFFVFRFCSLLLLNEMKTGRSTEQEKFNSRFWRKMSLSLHLECQKLSYDQKKKKKKNHCKMDNLAVVKSVTLKRIQCELSFGSWLANVRWDMNPRGRLLCLGIERIADVLLKFLECLATFNCIQNPTDAR